MNQKRMEKMKAKKLILGIVLVVLLCGYASAQTYLPNDTMEVVDSQGAPGDTTVPVIITLDNSINVAAFSLRLVYNPDLINPRLGPAGNPIAHHTSRSSIFNLVWGGTVPEPGVLTFNAATAWDEVVYIPPGHGPVVQFEFKINSAIQQDTSALIMFEDDPVYPTAFNNLSDELGTEVFIPIFTGGDLDIYVGGAPNQSPVFGPVNAQYTVDEGDSLGFLVSATDADGDTVTLYAESTLPTNATFPTVMSEASVSQNFVFKPDYNQGGVSYGVTFAAQDDRGGISRATVTIVVNDVAQVYDVLKVATNVGGVPGAKSRMVPVSLNNTQDVYGVQFTLGWDDSILSVDSIRLAPSVSDFSIRDNLGDMAGEVTVLLFDLDNASIPMGTEDIVHIFFSVDSLASCGLDVSLPVSDASEAINFPDVESRELTTVDGSFYVDCFGDVTLDKLIDVADVVSLVGYILGTIEYDIRQEEAADVNQDSLIDVGDLVGVINTILGRPIEAPGLGYTAPLAVVDLDLEGVKKGTDNRIYVHSEELVPVAGVQLKLGYDPDEITFSSPLATDRSDDFIIQYKDNGKGEMVLVMYNLSGKSIEPGEGNILSLPVNVAPGLKGEPQVEINEAIMADPGAVVIPVGRKGARLPVDFRLAQNYPNPFNPSTTIEFEITADHECELMVKTNLRIYNVLGRSIKTLVNETKTPGIYQVEWDGTDENGDRVSSGVYFYQLKAGDYKETRKMVLMK
jgi:hypothetical protein